MPQLPVDQRRADTLDGDAQQFLDTLVETGAPDISHLSPEGTRAVLSDLYQPASEPEPIAAVEDRTIRTPAREVPVRIYDPDPEAELPATVYFHGGGWVAGGLDTHDGTARSLANESECVVVSVDYRKAPEHPFPAAIEDAYEATKWAAAEIAGENGLAVAGESAGGNLAAVVAQMAVEKEVGTPDIEQQVLLYPVTDHDFGTHSYAENADGYFLTTRAMVYFWNLYLRGDIDGANPRASPLRAPRRTLAKLPATTIVTCGFDPLRDEGFAYSEALENAGVEVDHHHYDDMIHDVANMRRLADPFDGVEAAVDVRSTVGDALREAFE